MSFRRQAYPRAFPSDWLLLAVWEDHSAQSVDLQELGYGFEVVCCLLMWAGVAGVADTLSPAL